MKISTLLIAGLLAMPVALSGSVAFAQTQETTKTGAKVDEALLKRLTIMPDDHVIETTLIPMTVRLRYAEDKAAMLGEIGALEEPVRTLFWLNLLSEETPNGMMHSFFTSAAESREISAGARKLAIESGMSAAEADAALAPLSDGLETTDPIQHADAVAGALAKAGLSRQHGAFLAARELAAQDPESDFSRLDAAFGSEDDFRAAIGTYVTRVPTLAEWVAEARAKMEEEDRFHHLTGELYRIEDAEFDRLPKALRQIHVVDEFNAEMLNGSVHQFFFNSSGDSAHEVVAALRDMGLEKHAGAVQEGIDMFDAPYPTDTQARRRRHFSGEPSDWDDKLGALTGDVDDGEITPALIRLAKREGLLPR